MVYRQTMAPVGSVGLLSREFEGAEGTDIQRLKRVLIVYAYAAGSLSCVQGALAAYDSTPMWWCRGRG